MQEAKMKPIRVQVDQRHRLTLPKEFRWKIGRVEEVQMRMFEDESSGSWQIVLEPVGTTTTKESGGKATKKNY